MPRWKITEQILNPLKEGEYFDENWMNYDYIFQYAPEPIPWNENRQMKSEDVDIWEIITEMSGPIGVYAAWCPYDELYIVTNKRSVEQEFSGWNANKRLEDYLIQQRIPYPKV